MKGLSCAQIGRRLKRVFALAISFAMVCSMLLENNLVVRAADEGDVTGVLEFQDGTRVGDRNAVSFTIGEKEYIVSLSSIAGTAWGIHNRNAEWANIPNDSDITFTLTMPEGEAPVPFLNISGAREEFDLNDGVYSVMRHYTFNEQQNVLNVQLEVDNQQGPGPGGEQPRGLFNFLCQDNRLVGGHIAYKINGASDFSHAAENREENFYECIDLRTINPLSSITIKFEASNGYELDAGRGVTLRVNGNVRYSQNGEAVAGFVGDNGYTFNLNDILSGDESVDNSSFELEFGFVTSRDGGNQQGPGPGGDQGDPGDGPWEWIPDQFQYQGEDGADWIGYSGCFITEAAYISGNPWNDNVKKRAFPNNIVYYVHSNTIQGVVDKLLAIADTDVEVADMWNHGAHTTRRMPNSGYILLNVSCRRTATMGTLPSEEYVYAPASVRGVLMNASSNGYMIGDRVDNSETVYEVNVTEAIEAKDISGASDNVPTTILHGTVVNDIDRLGEYLEAIGFSNPEGNRILEKAAYNSASDEWEKTGFYYVVDEGKIMADPEGHPFPIEAFAVNFKNINRWPTLHVNASTQVKVEGAWVNDAELYIGFYEGETASTTINGRNFTISDVGRTSTEAYPVDYDGYDPKDNVIKFNKVNTSVEVHVVKAESNTNINDTYAEGAQKTEILVDEKAVSDLVKFTSEEKNQVIDGATLDLDMSVAKVDATVGNAAITTAIAGIEAALTSDENNNAVDFIDANLSYKIKQNGASEYGSSKPITETNEPMTISIPLSSALAGNSYYVVYRYHEGAVDRLPASYNDRTGMLSFDTDKFSVYALAVSDEPVGPVFSPNMLWVYSEEYGQNHQFVDPQGNVDCLVLNGDVDILSIQYAGHTYSKEELLGLGSIDGDRGPVWYNVDPGNMGYAEIPTGAIVTVKLLPDYGYQVLRAELNGSEIAPTEEQSVFTFTMPENNLHLSAVFTACQDEVVTSAEAVTAGTVELAENEMNAGSALLTVGTSGSEDVFGEKIGELGGYEIASCLNIGLQQIFYKGSRESYWANEKDTLSNNATITLDLRDNPGTDDVKVLHQKHNGEIEVLDATINAQTGAVTFETDSFSVYAIIKACEHADEDGNDICDKCGERLYIVAGYMYTEEGASVAGHMSGLAKYNQGQRITLVAPIVEGHNFVGWYAYDSEAANKRAGENLCTSRTYQFTVSAETSLVAVYRPIGNARISINGGTSFSINGVDKSSENISDYPLGSRVTVVCNSDDFEYWKNSVGMVVSRNKSYTFSVTGADSISAVLNTILVNTATVAFESYYGQVISRDQYTSEGTLSQEPGLPYRYGYTALGWDYNGDGVYNAAEDTFASALTRAFESANKLVTVSPVYELNVVTYTILVTGGTGANSYNQNDVVTVIADAPAAGKKFSHWADASDNVLSYNETFVFYASKNISIKAVYVDDDVKVEAKGTTEIIDTYIDTENHKLTFVSMSTVPEGCIINKAGIVATDEFSENLDASNAKFVRGNEWAGNAYRYTWTKANVQSGQTYYVRAYLVYTDTEGNVNIIYGDIVNLTME